MRTDYALRALFTLVDHFGGQPIPINELARRNDIPKRAAAPPAYSILAGLVNRRKGQRERHHPAKTDILRWARSSSLETYAPSCVSRIRLKRYSTKPIIDS